MSDKVASVNLATAPAVLRLENAGNGAMQNGIRPAEVAAPAKPAPNILKMVHDALRGRYLAVVSAGLIVGAVAAAGGWKMTKPIYTSEGLVRIAYSLPPIQKSTDQNAPLPMFDMFMQSQKTLIMSRRVMNQAIVDGVWKGYNRAVPANPDSYFAEHLKVDAQRGSELIKISVQDTDPATAAAAATAVVNSYQTLYNEQEKATNRQRLNSLQDDQSVTQSQMKDLTKTIDDMASEYGSSDLSFFYDSLRMRVEKLNAAIDDIKIAIANAPRHAPEAAATQAAQEAPVDPRIIGMTDSVMHAYLEAEERAQDKVSSLDHLPSTNPNVIEANKNLKIAHQKVTDYAEAYRLYHQITSRGLNDPLHPGVTLVSVDELKKNLATLEEVQTNARKAMIDVGQKNREIRKKTDDLLELQKKYDDITERMKSLMMEGSLGGRLSVINTGEAPLSPTLDRRPKMAAAAGLAGFLLPAALAFGLSFIRRRYRYVDDTAKDASLLNVPLLGMLPEVGRKFDPEVLHATAHGIHQMRVLLCAKAPRNAKRSYLITSATEGEGKTNLTVALGMSFAAARQRTLVIDCDFVGRRLTRGFKAENVEGVFEAMQEGSLGNRVRQEGPRLFVLPTGKVDSTFACGITTDNIRDLLSQTRGQYDTVIIDTGPILGSLEAAIVAQEVDGVILAISRGQHPTLVQHALRRLESVKAVLAGAVFNRAKLQDFHSSAYTSSYTSQPFSESISIERAGEPSVFSDFGPLVRAVSLGTPVAA